jgi:hypothetical protein
MTSPALERRGFERRAASRPPAVDAVDPADGATQVLRDAPVVVHLATPVDASSLSGETLAVLDPDGPIAGRLRTSPNLHVVIWEGVRPFRPGALHFVTVRGLRDLWGRAFPARVTCFVPCDLARDDLG